MRAVALSAGSKLWSGPGLPCHERRAVGQASLQAYLCAGAVAGQSDGCNYHRIICGPQADQTRSCERCNSHRCGALCDPEGAGQLGAGEGAECRYEHPDVWRARRSVERLELCCDLSLGLAQSHKVLRSLTGGRTDDLVEENGQGAFRLASKHAARRESGQRERCAAKAE